MDEIVAFAELERFIDLPVRTYSSGMYMRLGFSVAAHLQADVLLLDEVFAVGDEAFQRKCFGKIAEFKRRGGTIVFVSHDAQAVEMLCDRAVLLQAAAQVAFDGDDARGDRALPRLLADDASPDELAAGLREWGSGEARVVSARLLDADGDERRSSPAGEPFVVELRVAVRRGRARRRRSRSSCATTTASRSAASASRTAELGWDGARRRARAAVRGRSLPLADGRFHLRCALRRRRRRPRCCTRSATRCRFFVFPDRRRDRGRAPRRPLVDAGDRRRRANRCPTRMSTRSCPDWPELMELAPELQFKHYTLREAKIPAEALVNCGDCDFDVVEICCDLDSHVFNPDHTDPVVADALRATHWFDLREYAARGPGSNAA